MVHTKQLAKNPGGYCQGDRTKSWVDTGVQGAGVVDGGALR